MKKEILTLTAIVALSACSPKPTINTVAEDHPVHKIMKAQIDAHLPQLVDTGVAIVYGTTVGPAEWTDQKVLEEFKDLHGYEDKKLFVKRTYFRENSFQYTIYGINTSEDSKKNQ